MSDCRQFAAIFSPYGRPSSAFDRIMLPAFLSHFRVRSGRFAATCAAGAVLATVAGVALHLRAPGAAQQRWREEISQTPLDEVPALLEHLAEQDDVGLPVLVELLDDDHPDVALAAARALRRQIQSWRELPIDESSRQIAALAGLLAEQSEEFRSPGRYAAAQLAGEIIDWPLDENATSVNTVLAHCEAILRAAPARPDELMRVANRSGSGSTANALMKLPIAWPQSGAHNASPLGIAEALPGGGLAVEPGNNAMGPPIVSAEPLLPIPVVEPPPPNPLPPGEIYAPLAIPLELATQSPDGTVERVPSHANTPSSILPPDAQDLGALTDVELMRSLQAADRRQFAEEELRRRGFDALRLEVARRLTHPDPNVRKQLANALPQIAGVDARPWLTELSADPHPDVRRVAIAILATDSGDDVDQWLREIRHDESDPRIAEFIDGILDKRR